MYFFVKSWLVAGNDRTVQRLPSFHDKCIPKKSYFVLHMSGHMCEQF